MTLVFAVLDYLPLFPGSGKNQEAPPVSVHMFNGVFKFNPNTSLGKWVFISQTLLSFTPLLILLVQVFSSRPKGCVILIRMKDSPHLSEYFH